MTKDEKEPKKANEGKTEAASSTKTSEVKEKNFHLTWDHNAKKLPFSVLINGRPLFSTKKPSRKVIESGARLVMKMFSEGKGSTINDLTKAIVASKYDGIKLSHFAFICGMTLGYMDKKGVKALSKIIENPMFKKKSKAFENLQETTAKNKDQLYTDVLMVVNFGYYESQDSVKVEKIEVSGEKARKLIKMLEELKG